MTLLKKCIKPFLHHRVLMECNHVPFRVGNHDNNFIVDYDVSMLLWGMKVYPHSSQLSLCEVMDGG